ncbi:uncharacterized protein B0T15DRAFT_249721 [Chaetomium strumarium]|uniref:Extracellular protein n=1 Tax=Chaetomium strumarium TaxID=1170767 RepID=A0AAJ0GR69_9PEZI|nr:hypothetical protein B0T15DRAFT_249721 [Chaetomium strumarium]
MFANGLSTGALAVLLAGSQLAAAHMEISFPPPFRSKFNPHATNVDYTNTAPLAADGSNYPCKGYHSDLGTAAGASTATFAAGSQHNFTVVGGAPHGGGSCQVSLSYDKGKTFTVIQSIEGGCPLSSSYDFTIPADAPAGDAIWAWTWNNQIGNREFYMNCAAVTITGGSSKREVEEKAEEKRASAAFSSRPQVFVANLGNGCSVPEGIDVQYPNPGPDKVASGSKLAPPSGNCGSAASSGDSGSGSGSGSGSSAASSAVQATAAPATTAPASSAPLPGGVFITVPTGGASSSAPAAAPTTLVTSVASAPAASTVASAPAATGTGSAGSGSGSSAGGHAVGTACSNEGAWNCINGTSFQRCASGVWSAPMAVAAGTACKSGESEALSMDLSNSKLRLRTRFRGSAKLRLAA